MFDFTINKTEQFKNQFRCLVYHETGATSEYSHVTVKEMLDLCFKFHEAVLEENKRLHKLLFDTIYKDTEIKYLLNIHLLHKLSL